MRQEEKEKEDPDAQEKKDAPASSSFEEKGLGLVQKELHRPITAIGGAPTNPLWLGAAAVSGVPTNPISRGERDTDSSN